LLPATLIRQHLLTSLNEAFFDATFHFICFSNYSRTLWDCS
jgi:hypothetical protein